MKECRLITYCDIYKYLMLLSFVKMLKYCHLLFNFSKLKPILIELLVSHVGRKNLSDFTCFGFSKNSSSKESSGSLQTWRKGLKGSCYFGSTYVYICACMWTYFFLYISVIIWVNAQLNVGALNLFVKWKNHE